VTKHFITFGGRGFSLVFFPIISNFKEYLGWTSVHNFPPNNWEVGCVKKKFVHLVWSDGKKWNSCNLGEINPYESKKYFYHELIKKTSNYSGLWLTLDDNRNLSFSAELGLDNNLKSSWPMWRATIGLSDHFSSVSYQGEIIPFRSNGTLLSFFPFLQIDPNITNYILLVSLESNPEIRNVNVDFHSMKKQKKIRTLSLKSNNFNIVNISDMNITKDDVLICSSRDMCAIPLLISSDDSGLISFEHTHPPASYAILGNRFQIQGELKKIWFGKLN